MIRRTALLLGLFLIALAIPVDTHAQVAGTISGFVRDESGAVVPGAEVRATMIGQQVTRSAITDETGFFNLLAMRSATWSRKRTNLPVFSVRHCERRD